MRRLVAIFPAALAVAATAAVALRFFLSGRSVLPAGGSQLRLGGTCVDG